MAVPWLQMPAWPVRTYADQRGQEVAEPWGRIRLTQGSAWPPPVGKKVAHPCCVTVQGTANSHKMSLKEGVQLLREKHHYTLEVWRGLPALSPGWSTRWQLRCCHPPCQCQWLFPPNFEARSVHFVKHCNPYGLILLHDLLMAICWHSLPSCVLRVRCPFLLVLKGMQSMKSQCFDSAAVLWQGSNTLDKAMAHISSFSLVADGRSTWTKATGPWDYEPETIFWDKYYTDEGLLQGLPFAHRSREAFSCTQDESSLALYISLSLVFKLLQVSE